MYCSIEDILQSMDERLVAQLTNDSNPNSIDIDILQGIIDANIEFINGYLRGRYPLPLSNQHLILKQLAVELVKYDLYKRRDRLTDRIIEQRKDAINTLQNIQKGNITLNEGSGENRPSAIGYTNNDSVFKSILTKYKNMI